ncbi:MAG: glycosyltransferase family 4 protein [Campylobacterota bacterium]|nr:glycosyltransferase family 4 protein [Campylobacterota bacterium]
MSKIKIAVVNVFFPPQSIGGATRVVVDNVDFLLEKYGNEFELVIFTSDFEMHNRPHAIDCYMYKGIRVYRCSVLFREEMDWYAQDVEMMPLFKKFLDFEKPDKVHFHCVQRLSASVVDATLAKGIPYFITLHDAWWISDFQFLVDSDGKVYPNGHIDSSESIKLPKGVTRKASAQRKLYLAKMMQGAEKLFTVSESFKQLYNKNGVSNIIVTKNGISNKTNWLPKETSYTSKVVCGHIGGMSSHKGFDILKDAVLEVQPQNVEFLIVDHAKEEGYISKKKWGKIDITFIGRQNQENIVSLYGKIDVLFAPSIWPESFGLVTREASACGCWVVASNMGGIGEDILDGKNGFVIDPTQEALEKTLQKIDSNYKKYKTVAEKGNISLVEEQVKQLRRYLNG